MGPLLPSATVAAALRWWPFGERRPVATPEEVEATLRELVQLVDQVDPAYRALLPSRRTIEARCPDLHLVFHAFLRNGRLSEVVEGAAPRADIRVTIESDDLVALANREVTFPQAYAANRIRIDASMTDLLRLRAVL